MMAIPMAMGFAIAAGLRPEHGIVAGAVAGIVGGLFGGSKYNTYGPVAALIPVVAGLMAAHATPEDPYAGYGYMVLICMGSGLILMLVGLLGWGRFGNLERIECHPRIRTLTIFSTELARRSALHHWDRPLGGGRMGVTQRPCLPSSPQPP